MDYFFKGKLSKYEIVRNVDRIKDWDMLVLGCGVLGISTTKLTE